MGLDVYLEHCYNWEDYEEKRDIYVKETGRIWAEATGKYKSYNTIPQEIRDSTREKCKVYALSIGLNEDGSDPINEVKTISLDSKRYPEHYFKVGYFRSSYNSSGINSLLRDLLGEGNDLYYIFDKIDDEYLVSPIWKTSLHRVKEIRIKLKSRIKELKGFSCFSVDTMFALSADAISSPKEAMEKFLEELQKGKSFPGAFTNKDGYYSLDKPIQVYAVFQGKGKYSFNQDQVETYIVYKNTADYKFYIQALDIVEETINYVLKQPDIENYRLAWSA